VPMTSLLARCSLCSER